MYKGLSFFGKIIYTLNLVFVSILLLSYLTAFISPAIVPKFAILGLLYPVWLIANICFAGYWIVMLKKQFLTSTVAILLGLPFLLSTYQFFGKEAKTPEDASFKLMTFNARKYNFYEWLDRKEVAGRVEEMVARERPDIVMVQEHLEFWGTPNFGHYKKAVFHDGSRNTLGFATYSKFPIVQSGYESYGLDSFAVVNFFAWADIAIGHDTLRFINAHLASIGLPVDQYDILNKPAETSKGRWGRDLKDIVSRLWKAYELRGRQIPILLNAISESPHPVVLCGDINDPPVSYAAFQLSRKLNDSFRQAGSGFSKTYVKSFYPLRIDYIFHHSNLRARNYRVVRDVYSDHYPIVVDLQFNPSVE
jgi:endonuclease/exonuclease/phosphatase family metal-dependent hydrolase